MMSAVGSIVIKHYLMCAVSVEQPRYTTSYLFSSLLYRATKQAITMPKICLKKKYQLVIMIGFSMSQPGHLKVMPTYKGLIIK